MGRFDNILKVGEIYPTHSWGDVEVVEYINSQKVKVKFSDGNTKWTATKEVRAGVVKNDFQPFLYGVGYYGQGEFRCKAEGQKVGSTLEYETWRGIMRRCYDEKSFVKHPTYKGVTVCDEWHNYQNFAAWYTSQKGYAERWVVDKDLKILGSRVYSPETCSLIPAAINSLIGSSKAKRGKYPIGVYFRKDCNKFVAQVSLGNGAQEFFGFHSNPESAFAAYKKAKELHIKKTADLHKDDLEPSVYNNLMNYEVKITD